MDGLMCYFTMDHGQRRFRFGQSDPEAAAACAAACGQFVWDDEEECVDDVTPFCYNCRYRRWSRTSFFCMRRQEL